MQSSLNFKYPRARKLLLVVWCMMALQSSGKNNLPIHEIYNRYCQEVSSKRVPEEDFAKELLKALALLDINPKLKQPGNDAILRGIAWSQEGARSLQDSLPAIQGNAELAMRNTKQHTGGDVVAAAKKPPLEDLPQSVRTAHTGHHAQKKPTKLQWVSKPARRRSTKE
ncbi:hypothetical protein ABBQ38_012891 [Trebouxia sp. C0009 RCD-2024]